MGRAYFDEDTRPTEATARAYVREECNGEITLPQNTSRSNKKWLHIPTESGDEPLCYTRLRKGAHWVRKDVAVYPLGHKQFCTLCLAYAFPERTNINIEVTD